MESLISYKDPIFGVIVLAAIIIIVSIINFYTYKIKKYKESKQVDKIIGDFNLLKLKKQYTSLVNNKIISIDFLIQLMEYSYKIGDLEKTINIGMSITKYTKEPLFKQKAIKTLAKTYCKMGFLSRSIDLFRESLQIKPQDIQSLKYLLFLFDKTNQIDKAIQIIEPLRELGVNTKKYKLYFNIKTTLQNDDKNIKSTYLLEKLKKYPFIYKLTIEYFIKYDNTNIYKILNNNTNIKYSLDVFYFNNIEIENIENLSINKNAKIIFMLKDLIKVKKIKTSIYQLEIILNYLLKKKRNKLELHFQYICKNCKNININHANICPYCMEVFSIRSYPLLNKKLGKNEENKSFQ